MNSFGTIFRISIFGESHGPVIGVIVDGCPPGIPLNEQDFMHDLERRKPGKPGTTPRIEEDIPRLVSGVFEGKTSGSPITILFNNNNTRSTDYSQFKEAPRPGHADFTASRKYKGFNDYRGAGHLSGRVTVGLVAAGVIAKKVMSHVKFHAEVVEVGGSKDIEQAVELAANSGDSVGGLIECVVENLPVGLGEPFFDKTEALLAHILFAIPAVKALEFGSGFKAAQMKGSENNDVFIDAQGTTATNNAGGMNGGITNGNNLIFKVAVKPPSSISRQQQTYNLKDHAVQELSVKGRHDACIALRLPVIVEAASAIVVADLFLRYNALNCYNLD